MSQPPVAFYAPLKSPNHPSPSGDRTMARLLLKAIAAAGFGPELASELRTLDGTGDMERQERLRAQSLEDAARLIGHYRALREEDRPRLWFTYHVYYKAPDWIGPAVADALRIPYVVAEGSRASKRAGGPWALGHAGAEAALDRADAIFVMTEADRPALAAAKPGNQILFDLPPFLDLQEWSAAGTSGRSNAIPRLLTVAMMRGGDKLTSYRLLALALEQLRALPWTLDIVGDGEARDQVSGLFAPFGERVRFHGGIENRSALRAVYEQADILVWPAVNEAYGMALLEAQAFGCPVIAGSFGGVASVVRHQETGLLAPPGDAPAFAQAVAFLLADAGTRQRLGEAARRFVVEDRGVEGAAVRLRTAFADLLGRGEA